MGVWGNFFMVSQTKKAWKSPNYAYQLQVDRVAMNNIYFKLQTAEAETYFCQEANITSMTSRS